MTGKTISLKLIFSNSKGEEDIVIKEESGNFKDLVVPKGAIMMTVNLKIPDRIQKLNLTSHMVSSKTNIKLNGGNYLLVDPKEPPSIIIVHKEGKNLLMLMKSFPGILSHRIIRLNKYIYIYMYPQTCVSSF